MVRHYTDPVPAPQPRDRRLWWAYELPEAYELTERFITVGAAAGQSLEEGLRGYFVRALEEDGGIVVTVRQRRGHRHAGQTMTRRVSAQAPVWCHALPSPTTLLTS